MRSTVARCIGGMAILAVIGPVVPTLAQDASQPARNEITFTSWTGPYMRSQMLGSVRPYEAEKGVRVHVAHFNGGIAEIRDQVESANVVWEAVDLTQADSPRACKEGLLEDLSNITPPVGADGTPVRDDFIEGALNERGVGVIVWDTVSAYNKEAFAGNPPSTIADFFDFKKYPGNRSIRHEPSVIMEWALIAGGVVCEDVYATLETDAVPCRKWTTSGRAYSSGKLTGNLHAS